MSKAWAGGSTRAWRKTRARVLLRDGYRCQIRVPGVCAGEAPARGGHVHHIHAKSRCVGCAADLPDHLVAACKQCNLHVGDRVSPKQATIKRMTKW